MKRFSYVLILVLVLVVVGPLQVSAQKGGDPLNDPVFADFSFINGQLEAAGAPVRLAMYETYTPAASGYAGRTVYSSFHGNKQLSSHWVPGDPNRQGRTNISYVIDETQGATNNGLTAAQTTAAIVRANDTWQAAPCSTIPLTRQDSYSLDLGYVQYIKGYGGVPGWIADITWGGFLPVDFFIAFAGPEDGPHILGVTFTFVWEDANGPTDMDGNGKADVAFKEIYYNMDFPWIDQESDDYTLFDVESVALHEMGHGLSQAHFGTVFRTGGPNRTLRAAPDAVMNSIYIHSERELTASDMGGHCSIWAAWPFHS